MQNATLRGALFVQVARITRGLRDAEVADLKHYAPGEWANLTTCSSHWLFLSARPAIHRDTGEFEEKNARRLFHLKSRAFTEEIPTLSADTKRRLRNFPGTHGKAIADYAPCAHQGNP